MSLTQVTDKASTGHGYLAVYDQHFAPRRHDRLRVLEIGVAEGPSLELWDQYFDHPGTEIHGADIDITRCHKPLTARVRLWEMNQASEISLNNMALHLGPWDVIIDDGSHDPSHQAVSFATLWPHLRDGGLYCIEDLHVAYQAGYSLDMVHFLGGRLQHELHGHGKTGFADWENCPPDEQIRLEGRELEVKAIHLYRYLAIVEKR